MARLLPGAWILVLTTIAAAQSVPTGFKVERHGEALAGGTAMAFAPDGRLFVCQLSGAVRVIKNGELLATPFHTATVDFAAGSDRGLLGICVDPNFAANGYVYIYFSNPSPAPHNCVRRLRAVLPSLDVSDGTETAIVDLENLGADTMHNGGSIGFGGDGKLYIAVGDNAIASRSQSITSRFGKILRYNPDGSIPGDNPSSFAGIAGTPAGEFRAIWAAGLRNPFRFAFQPGTTRIFINDVGVDNWEEINEGAPGLNYGWEGGETDGARNLPGFTDPIFQYGQTGAPPVGRAITGGAFYNPSTAQFPAAFVGKYFFSDWGAGWIYFLDPATPGTASPFLQGASRPVDLAVGDDGALYYLSMTSTGTAGVYRVSYAAQVVPSPAPVVPPSPGNTGSDKDGSDKCGVTGFEAVVLLLFLRLFRVREPAAKTT